VRLESAPGDARARHECAAWRAADPEHERVWQRLAAIDAQFEHVPRRLALDVLGDRAASRGRRRTLGVIAALAAGGTGGWLAGGRPSWHELTADHATARGERRSIRLGDGTEVALNTATALDLGRAGERRLLRLRQGEIAVRTDFAGSAPRPLLVDSAHARFEPLGTHFLVRGEATRSRLVVARGAVAVRAHGLDARPAVVRAGEDVEVGPAGLSPTRPDGIDPFGWTAGVLAARDARLGAVVEELARYRQGWLRCHPRVADLRISGVYRLDDLDAALRAIARTLPVRLEARTRYWLTLTPR